MAEKKLSEELRHCLESDYNADCLECPYCKQESIMTCSGLLQKAYEVVKRYEEMFPCKVGDIVYYPYADFNFVFPVTISQIIISDLGEGRYCTQYNGCFFNEYGDPEKDFEFDTKDFGKDVFLEKEVAEKALKEMEVDYGLRRNNSL